MGPTRKRDLAAATVAAVVVGYLSLVLLYRWFPPITLWSGTSLAVLAAAEAGWGVHVRARIRAGEIGMGGGRLHPLTVARSVFAAKASAWVGALMAGWWAGAAGYLLQHRAEMRVAAADTPGALVASGCALALTAAALWLQYCCRSPEPPADDADPAPE